MISREKRNNGGKKMIIFEILNKEQIAKNVIT